MIIAFHFIFYAAFYHLQQIGARIYAGNWKRENDHAL